MNLYKLYGGEPSPVPARVGGAGRTDDVVVLLLEVSPAMVGGCGKGLGVEEVGGDEEGLEDGLVDDVDMLNDLLLG